MPNQKIELVKGGQKVNGVFEPITAKDLAAPTTPVLTPPKPATQAPGMIAEIGANADAFTQRLSEERAARQEQMQGSSSDLGNFLTQLKGETQLTNEAYAQDGGVDAVGKELQDINQKILAEQVALQRRLETIEKKGGGLVSGMQAEMDSVERESLRKQADLSVIQMGIQGRYDSAKAIADRAVSAYMEKQRIQLDALQFNYQENKDLFSTAEQREFDVMYDNRKRELDREEENLKQISNLSLDALANGAPPSIAEQMRSAKTVGEAMEIGGQYIGLYERMKVNSSLANDAMNRRKALLEMALAGDKTSIKELGFDPNAPDAADKVKIADQVTKLDEEILRVQQTLENTTGLETSAGTVRSPFLSSFGVTVPTATAGGAAAGSVIPGLGTVLGSAAGLATGIGAGILEYGQQRDAKASFLNNVNYIVANLTTEKVKQLKADGVAFTPMTDKDVELIGRAVSTLGGSNAIRDENGQVVGFVSESVARQSLEEAMKIMTESRDREYANLLSDEEIAEIDN